MEYKVISADTHVIEPPGMWEKWLEPEFRQYAPKLGKDAEGGEGWQYQGSPLATIGLIAVKRGRKYDDPDYKWMGMRFEDVNQGAFYGQPRLREQDEDGVDAEIIYAPTRIGSHFMSFGNREVGIAGYRAYNDWLAKEFCAVNPARLIGLPVIPTAGIEASIAELKRVHAMGAKGCLLVAWPAGGLNISPDDDQFWAVAEQLGLPVNIHVRLPSREALKPMNYPSGVAQKTSGPTIAPLVGQSVGALENAPALAAELIFNGTFDRFPRLQVVFGETGVSWVPYLMETMDDHYVRDRHWCHVKLDRLPSEYWKTNMAATFIQDKFAIRNRDLIGTDTILWSTDYPHHRCDWLDSQRIIKDHMEGVPAAERHAMLAGNAVRIYGLNN